MKASLLLLYSIMIICYGATQTNAQTSPIKWKKSFGGTSNDEAKSIQVTKNGGYIIAGNSQSTDGDVSGNHGSSDFWIVNIDYHGSVMWQKSYGGTSEDYANTVKTTSDGGYIVAGTTESRDGDVTTTHGYYDCWIVKLDSAGNIQWQRSFGGSFYDEACDIVQTSDGGYIFAGYTSSVDGDITTNHGNYDEWIVRLDNNGNILWQKTFGGSGDDFANSVQQTTDGGFIIAGETDSQDGNVTLNHGSSDYWIIKTDADGNIQWQKTYGGSSDDNATSVQQTPDGGYIVAGATFSTGGDVTVNHGGYDDWIVKLDPLGNLTWQRSYGGKSDDYPFCIQLASYGYIIAGYSSSNDGDVTGHHGSTNYDDYWVLGISTKGGIVGEVSLGGSEEDGANFIQQTPDGGMIAAGFSYSDDGDVTGHHGMTTSDDYWIVHLKSFKSPAYVSRKQMQDRDDLNTLQPSSVNLYPTLNQGSFEVSMNNSTISSSSAELVVLNESGQVILMKTEGITDGRLQDHIQLADLAPGLYFVKIESEGSSLFSGRFVCQR